MDWSWRLLYYLDHHGLCPPPCWYMKQNWYLGEWEIGKAQPCMRYLPMGPANSGYSDDLSCPAMPKAFSKRIAVVPTGRQQTSLHSLRPLHSCWTFCSCSCVATHGRSIASFWPAKQATATFRSRSSMQISWALQQTSTGSVNGATVQLCIPMDHSYACKQIGLDLDAASIIWLLSNAMWQDKALCLSSSMWRLANLPSWS